MSSRKHFTPGFKREAIQLLESGSRTATIGCIDCKKLVADRMVERMAPMWEACATLTSSPSRIDDIIQEGSRRATHVAHAMLAEVTAAMKI